MALIPDWQGLVFELGLAFITAILAPEMCCPDLGCFPLGSPWTSIVRPVPPPKCPDECPVTFQMYFRHNISQIYEVTWPVTSLEHIPFDGKKLTVLYVPGMMYELNDPWNIDIRKVYLDRRDVNFIFLNWGHCSNIISFLNSLSNLRVYAAQAARFMKYLITDHGAHPSRFHFIGHSWGAHLAAYTSRYIKGINRLTGLDPASIFFWGSKEVQIDVGDADFVEIGHTESIPILGFGIEEPKGHVDFYFNGNWLQPSCVSVANKEALRTLLEEGSFSAYNYVRKIVRCGHLRALDYYVDSLRETNCTIWGERMNVTVHIFNELTGGSFATNTTTLDECDINSCTPWGLDTMNYPARGSFTVATAEKPPYCIPRHDVDKRMSISLKEYERNFYKDYNSNSLLRSNGADHRNQTNSLASRNFHPFYHLTWELSLMVLVCGRAVFYNL